MNNRLSPTFLGKFLLLSIVVLLLVVRTSGTAKAQQTCGDDISYGQTLQQNNSEGWPHCDYYFQGNDGDLIEIKVRVLDGNLVPKIILADNNSQIITESPNGALAYQLNRGNGTYGFRVTSATTPRTYGSFAVLIQKM